METKQLLLDIWVYLPLWFGHEIRSARECFWTSEADSFHCQDRGQRLKKWQRTVILVLLSKRALLIVSIRGKL